ncbi:ImmA/IrrE family metallo-endopeptidase [Mesorhizobium sp. M7A.F.Ca.CA.001.09.2.1]|uniref:ImmA/IrrE family metallo-endopeptidase n=4 Tax=Mesorhizobium TaxID=68287 RepID=A0AB38TKE2_9HYPH|nr:MULTISPECIES: ImmA/IrrE family metallo-endopeptidase [Mesorhizobium]RUY54753.1 ImmA/IrrE family metallo-endopeptidase [Mesorhizobium sp. M7A.F.Ca.CA.001.13.2.1]MDF3216839.1 ImmA/IrrE family metallo-endopeptidase [Mesorhizobium ciceri]RUY63232.1 ImmA/IrrE family metallo-endopeptidase [Mesorhizobium sp. M7A.F.Ca.CA.001.05.1.1]RUY67196.1 ImmA/IrrE family metallo-endopeptidase [Mesorhizobium sp. M7A.F.Ca.CA.001.13.1.1]RUY69721.1 ImmA/IrrE family metallo-endopeptidase [Mesorhizobium sp. M7A.F.Ca
MAGFRLKMATQLGEKIAAEFGFDQFPVKPFEIARQKEIEVQAKPADVKGVSGAIIFANDKVTIIYSNEYGNAGFENFSLGHELGHYFLPGHPEEIIALGGAHMSRADFTQNSSIELEADHFASGLLMPTALTRKFLSKNQVGLDGILKLADEAGCSGTAAAIRAAECSAYPLAVIVSHGEQIAYAFMSNSFKDLDKLFFLRKGMPLPDSETLRFNKSPANVLHARRANAETTLNEWFDCPRRLTLDEEVIGLGNYGYTLTVLSSELLPDDPAEEEDEDAALEESWTPRFAYKR